MDEDEKIPETIVIDQELIKRWFDIPSGQFVKLEMPRVAFDMLYDSIHKNYEIHLEFVTALQNIVDGKNHDVKEFNKLVIPKIVNGSNSIKRFQTILMALATNTDLGAGGKVVEHDDGE